MSNPLIDADAVRDSETLLREGMGLAKCRKCQCMKDALDNISAALRSPMMSDFADLRANSECWLKDMEPVAYT